MDTITALAFSVQDPILTVIGQVLDSSLAYAIIVLGLLILGEQRNEKRTKIIISLILTFIIVTSLKQIIAKERPCADQVWCPDSHSFPSTHAALAFTLMTGFLNKKSYMFYLVFALFVAFTRMNLGVHTFEDIAGALPVALISYYATDIFWKKRSKENESKKAA
jgi:membrane-associated phospholipid phosphatase